jgi:PTH1 family peptidyl-tRNA hydrolase
VAHVVVGLGNPGPEYRDTRHNIGQRVVDTLAAQLKKAFHPESGVHLARANWRGDSLYLVKPQTFMNVSGPAVRRILHTLGAAPEDLVLVYDDIDMEADPLTRRRCPITC